MSDPWEIFMSRDKSDGYSTDASAGSLALPTSKVSQPCPEPIVLEDSSSCSETNSISSPVAPRTPPSTTARKKMTLLNLEPPPAPAKVNARISRMQSKPSENLESIRSELCTLKSTLSTHEDLQLYLWMPLEIQALLQRYAGYMDHLVSVKPDTSSKENPISGYQVQISGGSTVILVNTLHCSMISEAIFVLSTGFCDSWTGTLSELRSKVVHANLHPAAFTLLVRCTLGS